MKTPIYGQNDGDGLWLNAWLIILRGPRLLLSGAKDALRGVGVWLEAFCSFW